MNSETLETMRSIGYDTSTVVGVDKYTLQKTEFFPEFSGTPGIGSIWAPDYEKIVSLHPDAVFLYATVSKSSCDEIEERLARSSPEITVLRFDGYLPETYPAEIGLVSELLDCQEQGQEFREFYRTNLDTVTSRIPAILATDRVRVYFETWTDYKSCAQGSGYDQKIGMAGGSNIFANEPAEYPEIDPEAVLDRSPQVVIKLVGSGKYTFGGYQGGDEARFSEVYADIISRKGWDALEAVRDDRTYVLHTDILGGPQFFIGVQYLATWFHPEQFADLDPAAVHAEYLARYQRLPHPLSSSQIFVYPS
jgi:iron complex transport system substrate-binding protein